MTAGASCNGWMFLLANSSIINGNCQSFSSPTRILLLSAFFRVMRSQSKIRRSFPAYFMGLLFLSCGLVIAKKLLLAFSLAVLKFRNSLFDFSDLFSWSFMRPCNSAISALISVCLHWRLHWLIPGQVGFLQCPLMPSQMLIQAGLCSFGGPTFIVTGLLLQPSVLLFGTCNSRFKELNIIRKMFLFFCKETR